MIQDVEVVEVIDERRRRFPDHLDRLDDLDYLCCTAIPIEWYPLST